MKAAVGFPVALWVMNALFLFGYELPQPGDVTRSGIARGEAGNFSFNEPARLLKLIDLHIVQGKEKR